MTAKEKKAEYDRKRRLLKKEELRIKAREYNESPAGRAMQKRQREKRKEYHNEYCRTKEQRKKERLRRHKNKGLDQSKTCLICDKTKEIIQFQAYLVFPDKRNYMCRSCEEHDKDSYCITTREVLQTIRSNLVKTKSNLKIQDMAKYPYLIEANKYLLLLKRLTK